MFFLKKYLNDHTADFLADLLFGGNQGLLCIHNKVHKHYCITTLCFPSVSLGKMYNAFAITHVMGQIPLSELWELSEWCCCTVRLSNVHYFQHLVWLFCFILPSSTPFLLLQIPLWFPHNDDKNRIPFEATSEKDKVTYCNKNTC